MAGSSERRTQVQAIDELTREVRLSNLLAVLALPGAALDHDAKGEASQIPATAARAVRRNRVRAEARALLGIEVVS